MMKVKLDGTKYSRDLTNMALVCNDLSEVSKYENEMLKVADNRKRDSEINSLRAELIELKSMLTKALDQSNKG